MQVTIAAVGRDRTGAHRALYELYCRRCPWQIALVEVPLPSLPDVARRRAMEAGRLARAVAGAEAVVALDEAGTPLGSEAFAATIGSWREQGLSRIGFLIGGPDGLDPEGLPPLDLRLAFGPMTWPHQLVRVMLAEQLYRASTILAGHPYHRG